MGCGKAETMKNVCIVGYGAIGPVHARALEAAKSARLYAVCDVNPERVRVCRETYDVKAYRDFDQMLMDQDIHSVHICTPHYLHFEMIRKALAADKEVVSEKPVTRTREEFAKLLQLDGAQKVCMVLQNRLNPCVEKLKELVQSGELGAVKAVKAIVTWHRDESYYRDSWKGKWETEGGCLLINQAIHTLDVLFYTIGDITNVKSNMFNYSLENVIEAEDTLVAYLGFVGGAKGVFFATNAYGEDSSPLIEVVFENRTVRYVDKKLWAGGQILAEDAAPSIGKAYWGSGHTRLIKGFYDEQKYFSIHDIKNTMDTVFAMYDGGRLNLRAK